MTSTPEPSAHVRTERVHDGNPLFRPDEAVRALAMAASDLGSVSEETLFPSPIAMTVRLGDALVQVRLEYVKHVREVLET